MSDPLRLDLPVLLPDAPDARDDCARRLTDELSATPGVERAHVVPAEGGHPAQLCLHYDPDVVALPRLRRAAERAGAQITRRYGHVLWAADGLSHQRRARTVTERLRQQPGVVEAEANAAGPIRIEFDREPTTEADLRRALAGLGVTVAPEPAETLPLPDSTLPDSPPPIADDHVGHDHAPGRGPRAGGRRPQRARPRPGRPRWAQPRRHLRRTDRADLCRALRRLRRPRLGARGVHERGLVGPGRAVRRRLLLRGLVHRARGLRLDPRRPFRDRLPHARRCRRRRRAGRVVRGRAAAVPVLDRPRARRLRDGPRPPRHRGARRARTRHGARPPRRGRAGGTRRGAPRGRHGRRPPRRAPPGRRRGGRRHERRQPGARDGRERARGQAARGRPPAPRWTQPPPASPPSTASSRAPSTGPAPSLSW